jgi:ABC-type cobalamin/Fe3+-siderophores transport system ATPase subunit
MLELLHLTGGYNGEVKVNSLSAEFKKDEITAIVGPNGCGKSTLLKLIVRLLKPMSGKIILDGSDVSSLNRKESAQKISFLPQARSIPHMSAGSLILHGRYPYLSYSRKYTKKDQEAVENAIMITGTEKFRDTPMDRLSGGERQKVYIAMLIAQDTEVVLLDEPTTYLDMNHQFELMNIIKSLKQQGKTVVIVLHDLSLALQYADRVIVMDQGKLTACGAPREICLSGTIDKVFHIHTQRISSSQYVFSPDEKNGLF